MMRALFFSALLFLLTNPLFAEEKMLYPSWDSHLHYLDFTQKTEGFPELIKQMDAAGIEQALIFGMPIVKMWSASDPVRPDYYLDSDSRGYYYSATDFILAENLRQQPQEIQRRFHPFICGINPLDLNAADYIETLLKTYPGFWKGIGEVMSRHDDLTAFTYGEPPSADHPALMKVYQLAAKHELPVIIHHNISSTSKKAPIYLPEIERALKAHPKTTFIWAHVVLSRRLNIPTLLTDIKRLLSTYPNLYFDISWVVYDEHMTKSKQDLIKWVELIEQYPTRFALGSDKVGHWKGYAQEMTKYNRLLKSLKPDTARKVSKENIQKLLSKE